MKLSNELTDYCPKSVETDIYYYIVSKPTITEICYKNKQVMQAIIHKAELDIEEYTDLVQAIGFMVSDYCKRIFIPLLDGFISEHRNYSFSVDKDALIDIALGKRNSEIKWCSKRKNEEIWILKYKYNRAGELIECRNSKNDEKSLNVSDSYVIHIGMLKMYVSDSEKKVYCLSTADEYLYVKKSSDNKYFAHPFVA